MRVAVFGATGPTGLLLVRELLGRGHDVVAFARNPSRLPAGNPRMTLVSGELTDRAAIADAVRGCDAVASALGPHGRSPGLPITAGMRRIVSAMDEVGVGRLVQVSTASATDPRDRPDVRQRLLVAAVRTLVPTAYAEARGVAHAVRSSDLAWTLVRVPLLHSARRAGGGVRVGYPGVDGIGFLVARESVAKFVADRLERGDYLRESPMICDA
jgi:putative NADH-flavin reductase